MSTRSVALEESTVEAFLGNEGTGVLSLARDDDAYGFPVSYGYDAQDGQFYLRLGFAPNSEKRSYIAPGRTVSLVVYDDTDEGWTSVVARGTLEEIGEAAIDSDVVEAIRRVNIPFVTIYDRPARELEFQLFRLRPETLSGYRETGGD